LPPRSRRPSAPPPRSGGRISRLSSQKRAGRVNVYLDDEFWLGVSAETLLQLGLYVGQELTPEELETIEAWAGGTAWFDRAANFLSYRPRSEREVARKLRDLGASEEEVSETLERLRSLGLVDDREFAATYLRDRDAVRPYGTDRLRQELYRLGVAREVIDEVLSERDPEQDYAQARSLAERDPLWSRRSEREASAKLFGKLRRRGFGSELIRRVLED
jgi:regulatory protein